MTHTVCFPFRLLLLLCCGGAFVPGPAGADGIRTDGTVGADANWRGRPQTLSGSTVTITEEMGSTAGRNLFHSFESFNVATGQTVRFTGDSRLQNVISRVTGADGSDIDGTLRSEIGRANFYLINPHGVTFGPNARIDVPAAFHVSTADELSFADGARFSAREPSASTLSAAEPKAFGYLDSSPSSNGLIRVDGAQLEVAPGETLDMVADEIQLEAGAQLRTEGGEIRLLAGRGGGTVGLERAVDGFLPLPESLTTSDHGGALRVDASGVDASGDGGGRVSLGGGRLTLDQALVFADNLGPADASAGRGIRLRAGSADLRESFVTTDVFGDGVGADIDVRTKADLTVADGTLIASRASVFDPAVGGGSGRIVVEAGNDLLIDGRGNPNGTGIVTETAPNSRHDGRGIVVSAGRDLRVTDTASVGIGTTTAGAKKSGDVRVVAGRDLTVSDPGSTPISASLVFTQTLSSDPAGSAGKVVVEAGGSIGFRGAAGIVSNTAGAGDTGTVDVSAGQDIVGDRLNNPVMPARIGTQALRGSTGSAGRVAVTAERGKVEIRNGAQIGATTFGSGDGGDVLVQAATDVIVDGAGSQRFTVISAVAEAGSTGNAGQVQVNAVRDIQVLAGGTIAGSTYARGRGGRVSLHAGRDIVADGQGASLPTGVAAMALEGSSGDAGKIELHSGRDLRIRNSAQIGTGTLGAGRGGDIEATVDGTLAIDGGGRTDLTGIFSGSAGANSQRGGNIVLHAARGIELVRGGHISASTSSQADAGNIAVISDGDIVIDGAGSDTASGIASAAGPGSTGNAGAVVVKADRGAIRLTQGGFIHTDTNGVGGAGDVDVSAGSVTLSGSGIASSVGAASSGRTGSVSITASRSLTLTAGSEISVFTLSQVEGSPAQPPGRLNIAAQDLTVDGSKILAMTAGTEDGGSIRVTAGRTLTMTRAAEISATTTGTGAAGSVAVSAPSLSLDQASISAASLGSASGGRVGTVAVTASDAVRLSNGASLSIVNQGFADDPTEVTPGHLSVQAGTLSLSRSAITADTSGNVDAGVIDIAAERAVSLSDGSRISSSASGSGRAGALSIRAERLVLDRSGIQARAERTSGGAIGGIGIVARRSVALGNDSEISVANDAVPNLSFAGLADPAAIRIEAPRVRLARSTITSRSAGPFPADAIAIAFGPEFRLDDSAILTEAATSRGGTIDVTGTGRIALTNSRIASSVANGAGNGGNITLKARVLSLDTGLIEAKADSGDGGRVLLDVQTLLASGNSINRRDVAAGDYLRAAASAGVWQAGDHANNIISAASREGLSGTIDLASPQLNLNGALSNLGAPVFDSAKIGLDACRKESGSTLSVEGRGGLPPRLRDWTLY